MTLFDGRFVYDVFLQLSLQLSLGSFDFCMNLKFLVENDILQINVDLRI